MTETVESETNCGRYRPTDVETIGALVRNRYRICKKISCGSFGVIYAGVDKTDGSQVAIKLVNRTRGRKATLKNEIKIYKRYLDLGNRAVGIPVLHWFGEDTHLGEVMVLDLMGYDLEKLLRICQRKLSLKTILMIGIQMLERLRSVHSRLVVHRDLKPENFILGTGPHSKRIFIIDFGLSKPYIDRQTGNHIAYRTDIGVTGTARYCSINTNRGNEQSRRDDMESVAYLMSYFFFGSLPWQGLRVANSRKHTAILSVKVKTSTAELFRDMPSVFQDYLEYCRNLEFEDEPDYQLWINKFRRLFEIKQYKWDYKYDWDLVAQYQGIDISGPAIDIKNIENSALDGDQADVTAVDQLEQDNGWPE